MNIVSPKKLIEVALPLDAINVASAREKSIRHGHPSTLHLWWARRPLAAARAVIFSQLVHDPEDLWRCQNPGVEANKQHKGHWTKRRAELFRIIEELVKWENTTNERVLNEAREEIRRSWRETCELNKDHPQAKELFDPKKMPGLHDPFAGGGAIPLEAQRLGLEAYASDLNPVAVLINKAMIEIPPKFAGKPPVHPAEAKRGRNSQEQMFEGGWKGAAGLAEDVRYYGQWMRDEAFKRIGHLYPPVEVTKEMAKDRPDLEQYVGEKRTVIAWLWARTVKSPNPAFSSVDVPLAGTFVLSSKAGKEAYVEPVITKSGYSFKVHIGKPNEAAKQGTKASRGNFRCLMSGSPIDGAYIRTEAKAGRLGQRLMAIVAEGKRSRLYLSPIAEHESVATAASPMWKPDVEFFQQALGFRVGNYGMSKWSDAFTARQLVALSTFASLVREAYEKVRSGATHLEGHAESYAAAIAIYLAFAVDRLANRLCTLCVWNRIGEKIEQVFKLQALSMTWDFPETNVFSESSGGWSGSLEWVPSAIELLPINPAGHVTQENATQQTISSSKVVCTDPPYFDNIGYADLSDFFYVWLRASLREIVPDNFVTVAVPKAEELVATPHRHGGKKEAEAFFLRGMSDAMRRIVEQAHPGFPACIYYAFKQSESGSDTGTSSTGWETFLEAVIHTGFAITGTWPVRTERDGGVRTNDRNSLASSVVLVCRQRVENIGTISRRQFVRQLNEALPLALDAMTRESEGLHSPVAPVDLSQAIIGPGMAIFSRYDAVLEADGTPMTVKTALQLINRFLAEDDFDHDTQFCLRWFEQHHWDSGQFGEADVLARAKGTSVAGVKESGVIESGGGKVRLLKWKEYPADWDASSDKRLPVWEALHQLIRAFNTEGDSGAAKVLAATANKAEAARQLAYRLYTLCERAGLAEDARAYNEVVTGWSGIESAAVKVATPQQRSLFEIEDTL